MGLEADIHQTKPFQSEFHKAVVNILFSNNWVLEKLRQYLEQEDITPQQYNILRILRGCSEPISTLQIRERMLDKMSNASRMVDRLVLKELVSKKVHRKDKRLVDVTITEKGLRILQRLDGRAAEIDAITEKLSDEEVQTLNLLLDKMRTC
ncbi:MAG: MarR family transcriptional regulator [Bacteroidota bacterium]|nr:MarR family transcriptional regulator [Bacteroidota bacterium]